MQNKDLKNWRENVKKSENPRKMAERTPREQVSSPVAYFCVLFNKDSCLRLLVIIPQVKLLQTPSTLAFQEDRLTYSGDSLTLARLLHRAVSLPKV